MTMQGAVLVDGTTMTDLEWSSKFGLGDVPTDFVPTKADLISLAYGLTDDLIAQGFRAVMGGDYYSSMRMRYTNGRLSRLIEFIEDTKADEYHELDDVRERLRRGIEANDRALA